jgi:protein CpxP
MTTVRKVSLAAILVAALAGGVAFAQGGGPGRRGGGPGAFGGPGRPGGPGGAGLPLQALNLSDTQKDQVKQLLQQSREQNRAAAAQLRTAMDAQRKAVESIPADEGLIRSTTQALVEAQTEMAIQQSRLQGEIFAMLTPAQQDQARKLKADRDARLQAQRQQRQQQGAQQPKQRQ